MYPPMLPTSDPFDPASLRLTAASLPACSKTKSTKLPRHRHGEWFLCGPIPWTWLEKAACLTGKALHLSLVLWREGGRRHCRTVKVSLNRVGLGMSEYAARRALRSLEAAGLVSVLRKPGRGLEVTILEAPAAER